MSIYYTFGNTNTDFHYLFTTYLGVKNVNTDYTFCLVFTICLVVKNVNSNYTFCWLPFTTYLIVKDADTSILHSCLLLFDSQECKIWKLFLWTTPKWIPTLLTANYQKCSKYWSPESVASVCIFDYKIWSK